MVYDTRTRNRDEVCVNNCGKSKDKRGSAGRADRCNAIMSSRFEIQVLGDETAGNDVAFGLDELHPNVIEPGVISRTEVQVGA